MTNLTELYIAVAVDDAHFDPDSHRSARGLANAALTTCTAADAAAHQPVDIQQLRELLSDPARSEQGSDV